MFASAAELLAKLTERDLIAPEHQAAARDEAEKAASATPDQLLTRLVDRGFLTVYQADAVREGRLDDLVLDRYVIQNRIGEGGMGQVFQARHRHMGRMVALKLMSPHAVSSDFIERFENEMKAAARLQHPNIVAAFDAGKSGGRRFLVMEYVFGETLGAMVSARGPLEPLLAADLIRQAALGLHGLHEAGLVHRDVKPGNLMRTHEGVVKVLDVGLARWAHDRLLQSADLTMGGVVLGTVAYMSPEQAQDPRGADRRSDIYSLGCTLYYLLSGKPLYEADTLGKMLVAHRERPIPTLRSVCPAAPETLEKTFQRMAAKRPEDRFASMAQVVVDLERTVGAFSGGEPSAAPEAPSPKFEMAETLVAALDEREFLRRFLDEPAPHRCLRPRFFAGIASPWDMPLPSHDFYEILAPACEALGGRMDAGLRPQALLDLLKTNTRFDVVVLVAHGDWSDTFSLHLLQDGDPRRLSTPFPLDRLANVLHHLGTKLAIMACCQNYQEGRLADLGDHLIQAAPGLCAVVTFRTRLPFDTAHHFLGELCRRLTDEDTFPLDDALDASRRSVPSMLPGALQRFDFAIPTVHVRRLFELQRAPAAGWIDVDRDAVPTVHFPVTLQPRFRNMAKSSPTPPVDNELARIENEIGSLDGDAGSTVVAVARYPVTRREYWQFLNRLARDDWNLVRAHKPAGWTDRDVDSLPSDVEWLPVTGVRKSDVLAYIDWLNAQTPGASFMFDLPLLREWIALAYAGHARLFPWGDGWRPWNESSLANAETEKLAPVYEPWRNEVGVYGMMGNCWELLLYNHPERVRVIGGGCRSPRWTCTAFAWRDIPILENGPLCVEAPPAPRGPAAEWDVGFRLVKRQMP